MLYDDLLQLKGRAEDLHRAGNFKAAASDLIRDLIDRLAQTLVDSEPPVQINIPKGALEDANEAGAAAKPAKAAAKRGKKQPVQPDEPAMGEE